MGPEMICCELIPLMGMGWSRLKVWVWNTSFTALAHSMAKASCFVDLQFGLDLNIIVLFSITNKMVSPQGKSPQGKN